jgi:hypothetical protein
LNHSEFGGKNKWMLKCWLPTKFLVPEIIQMVPRNSRLFSDKALITGKKRLKENKNVMATKVIIFTKKPKNFISFG